MVIFKKKRGGYILKIITKLYVTRNDDTTSFCYEEEEIDSDDDMEYTEDAIDNMIL